MPNGFDSFPACKGRHEGAEPALELCAHLQADPDVPEPVRNLWKGQAREWHADVSIQTLFMMVRDVAFDSDARMMAWVYESNFRLFNRPVFRTMMKLVSPNLVLMGASRRWSTFRLGTELRPGTTHRENGRCQSSLDVTYPEGLFPELFLHSLGHVFRAALDSSRGRDVAVELGGRGNGSAAYRISWAS